MKETLFTLNYKHKIKIPDVPLQWMTRIELFSSDLEQFPLMYVHILASKENVELIGEYNPASKQRIFGFALSAKWGEIKKNDLCDVEIDFLCNIPPCLDSVYDNLIINELSHRIGLADKVGFDDLENICANSPETLPLLKKIWLDKIEIVYGKYIPHGRLFDELYGIVRFSASGNAPKLGKTSEYRMLYWYMKDLGESAACSGDAGQFGFMELYLLPTYEELTSERFHFFNKFLKFYKSTKIFWELEYTESFSVGGHSFRNAMKSSETLPISAENFENRYPALLGDDYDNISKLRQIFNRLPGRLYGYIWNLMTPVATDFKTAFSKRNTFKEFYRDHSDKKGSSSKVVACFLQQAFGIEALPIDTWVKTFIYYPLGMSPKDDGRGEPPSNLQDDLYSKYNRLDKLEKLIWASSMGNKTNKKVFLDILWCQRYGTDKGGKGPTRGANPLSCSMCILKNECLSYNNIKDETIFVAGEKTELASEMKKNDYFFGVLTDNETPRKVYTIKKGKLDERDSHTGLDVPSVTKVKDGLMTMNAFVELVQ
jgi:hypothetical protein